MTGHIMAFEGRLPTIAADAFIAPTATATDPCAVIMLIFTARSLRLIFLINAVPVPSGRLCSTINTSGAVSAYREAPSAIVAAATTSCPCRSRNRARFRASSASSSTTRMRVLIA